MSGHHYLVRCMEAGHCLTDTLPCGSLCGHTRRMGLVNNMCESPPPLCFLAHGSCSSLLLLLLGLEMRGDVQPSVHIRELNQW